MTGRTLPTVGEQRRLPVPSDVPRRSDVVVTDRCVPFIKERADQCGDVVRLLEVGGVVGILDDGDPGQGTNAGSHAVGQGSIAEVPGADHQQYWHTKFGQAAPQGLLAPRSGQTKTGGQAGSAALKSFGSALGALRYGAEQRLAHPSIQELGQGVTRNRTVLGIEAIGQLSIGVPSCRPLGLLIQSRSSRNEHQAMDQCWLVQGQPKAVSSTHRVAHIVARSAYRTEESCAFHDIGVSVGRTTVAGQIDGHDETVLAELAIEPSPDPAVLGETVGQDRGTPCPGSGDVEVRRRRGFDSSIGGSGGIGRWQGARIRNGVAFRRSVGITSSVPTSVVHR